jgi:hypothetical protein
MGADFSFKLGSLAWNECSGRVMDHLAAAGSSGVIFSVFEPQLPSASCFQAAQIMRAFLVAHPKEMQLQRPYWCLLL